MADVQALVEIVGRQSVSGPAGVAAGALSAVEAAAGKAGSVLGGLATAAAKTGVALASIGAAGVVAGLTSAVTAAAGFEKQMSAVGAVSGASAQQMKDLSALALKLGADTSFSASESAQGIGELVKAGVSLSDVMGGAAKASLDLAAAGGVDVATAAEIASNAMNVFSIKGKDMAHVADEIAGAANASAIDVNDYKFSLAAAGSVAATVGIGFDDLSTAIAVMGQAGIKGSDAGTSLKTMLLNLTPSTKSQRIEAEKLGIITKDGGNQFFDAAGKAKSMAEIAGVLQEATKGLTEQQKLQALQTLFGTDAIRAAAIMAHAGAGGFNEMAAAIGKVSASDVANTRLDNLAGSIEKFKGSAETAAITVGQHLTPPLRRLVDVGTDLLNNSLPALDRFGTMLGAAFDGLITKVQAAAPALATVRDIAERLAGRAGQGLGAVHEAVLNLINDFGGLVGVDLDQYARGWDTLREALGKTLDIAQPTIDTLLNLGHDALPMVQRFAEMAVPALKLVGQYLADYVTNNVRFLTTYVLPAFYDVAVQTFAFFRDEAPVFSNIATVLREQLGKTLLWIGEVAWPDMVNIARQTVEWFNATLLPLIPGIADMLRNGLGGALDWLATKGWPALLRAATAAITWVQSTGIPALSGLVDWLGPKLSAVLTWVAQTGWPALVAAGSTVSDWVTGTALPALSDLWDWLSPKLSAALGWLTDTGWPALVSAGQAVTGWVTGTAVPALTSLVEWLGPKVSAVVSWLTDTGWPTFVSAATAVTDWITQTAIPALTPLVMWLGEKLREAASWLIDTGWPMFVSAAEKVSTWITETAVPALTDLWSWLEQKTRPAVQWFIDTGWPALQAAGQTVVQMWTDLSTWTQNFWDTLEKAGVLDSVATSLGLIWDAGKILVETFWPQMIGDDASGAKGAFTATDVFVTLIKGAAGFLRSFAEGVHTIAEGFKALKDALGGMPALPDWFATILRGMGPAGAAAAAVLPAQHQGGGSPSSGSTGATGSPANYGPIDNGSRASFVRTAYPYMLQAAGGNKDLAEMMLAAAISENGDVGKGGDFVGNNFFGIKGKGPTGKSNSLDTWEWEGGQRVNQKAEFAAYDDPVQGFQGFMDFLTKNSRYAPALAQFHQTGDAQGLFNGINQAGYATNPNWAGTIGSIRRNQVAPVTAGIDASAVQQVDRMSASVQTLTTGLAAAGAEAQAVTPLVLTLSNTFGTSAGSITTAAAGLATDVPHNFDLMATGAQTTVTEMNGFIQTHTADAWGNIVDTLVDAQGNVVDQTATMADGVRLQMSDLGVDTYATFDEMKQQITTSMQDANHNVVETVTDMAGHVISQTSSMAATTGASLDAVGTAAENAVPPLDAFGQTIGHLPTPNLAPTADQFALAEQAADDARKAAEEYASYLADLDNFDWNPDTNRRQPREYTPGSSDDHRRAGGGPVSPGTWLVGEAGPELMTLGSGLYGSVTSNADLRRSLGGGNGLGPPQRIEIDITADGRTKEKYWIEGYQLLAQRGGLPSTFGAPA